MAWAEFERPFLKFSPTQLPDALAACLLPWPLTPEQKRLVTQPLTPGLSVSEQIRTLTTTLMSLPHYQLC